MSYSNQIFSAGNHICLIYKVVNYSGPDSYINDTGFWKWFSLSGSRMHEAIGLLYFLGF